MPTILDRVVYRLTQPLAVRLFRKEFGNRTFRLLDVGAGNHSAIVFTTMLPNCEYYGVDITRAYGNDEQDFARMTDFWEMDVTQLAFEPIPDNFFDALNLSHIIEHLWNGDRVITELLRKLKMAGIVYIEYPRFHSTCLPSMRDTLNFFDDETHCRIYGLPELYNLFLQNGCRPLRGGTRRDWFNILLMPVQLPRAWIKRGYLAGSDFYDLLGFAEYVLARKK